MRKLALVALLSAIIGLQADAQDSLLHAPKGSVVKIITTNHGEKIKLNDVITFHVVQKTEKDSVLFSSYTMGHPLKIQVQESQNAGDLMDVFPLLAAKDSALVKVPTDSIFIGHEDQRPPFLPKGSSLLFTLQIERVQSLQDAMAERNAEIEKIKADEKISADKYIADNKLVVKTTASGLKYVITQPSAKRKVLPGDTLLVNYTGSTIDGKVFDSSIKAEAEKAGLNQPGREYEPLSIVAGSTPIIKGWDEGLLLLNEGSKAKFIIPSDLAYGDQGQGPIAPYSTLIFDVEVVKIKPTKHVAPKPAVKKTPTKTHTAVKKKN
jgi:FKBP-type peptidyl-prolyl cis-trans isomerase